MYQMQITRTDLRSHPNRMYLFGDNEARKGYGGLASECRGEPNAIGVATKRFPSHADHAFWHDDDIERCCAIIDADLRPAIEHVKRGGTVMCPAAGLGTGLSELPKRAPKIYSHLCNAIAALDTVGPR
jgi:hypothetical protein